MTFTPGPAMGSARYGCTAGRVDAQHVLVIGGQDPAYRALATTELLDVATMEFSPGPTMQAGRYDFAAVLLDTAQGPQILVVGGNDCDVESLSTTEVLAVEN